MRSILLGLLLGLLSFVSALSAVGGKLLVIIEDESEKSKYSTFWTDLECMLMYYTNDDLAQWTNQLLQQEASSSHTKLQKTPVSRCSSMASPPTPTFSSSPPSQKVSDRL